MLSKSRWDVIVHAEFRFSDPIPPRSANPCFAGRQPRGGGRDAEIPSDPFARPPSSLGPPNRHSGVEISRHVRGIAHVSP